MYNYGKIRGEIRQTICEGKNKFENQIVLKYLYQIKILNKELHS